MGEAFEEIGDQWRDDAFGRRAYAEFLTTYLRAKVLGAGQTSALQPFTMALDANWGAGKTFFLQRWAEGLRSKVGDRSPHTVVYFDAWAADYAEDPLVAFMSELRAALDDAVSAAGLKKQAAANVRKAIDAATRNIRQVALPALGLVAKGMFHKFSGVALNEIVDMVRPNGAAASGSSNPAVTLEDVIDTDQADAAVDFVFNAQLSEHTKRKAAIKNFKNDIGTVLAALGKGDQHAAPLFIFVDELDRCKPSFAVGLLEAIKHIFGVPGICIVVATNMDQLTHTVKSVYGEGFDARTYLQRFFDAIYALPQASGPKLLERWISERPIFSNDRCKWAKTRNDFKADEFGVGAAGMLAWIFSGLGINLRAQGQVLELMEAAATGIPESRRIHVPWLAIVCGLWHSHAAAFEEVELQARTGSNADQVWLGLRFENMRRTHFVRGRNQEVSLRELAGTYAALGTADLRKVHDSYEDHPSYSALITHEILSDASRMNANFQPTGLLDYFQLTRTAGHFIPRSEGATSNG